MTFGKKRHNQLIKDKYEHKHIVFGQFGLETPWPHFFNRAGLSTGPHFFNRAELCTGPS